MLRVTLFTLFCMIIGPALVAADPRYVFAHFMVGNSYPYTLNDWTEDILAAQGYGIDGFALNIGSDGWQPARIADAYAAAAAIAANNTAKTPFKLFLSFDMTCLSDAGLIVNYIRQYHGHGNQFVYQGKDFVSTFSGEYVTFGLPTANEGWQVAVKNVLANDGIYIYFVPQWSAFAPTGVFQAQPVIDGMLCWTAWPEGNSSMTSKTDQIYMDGAEAAGKTYMAAWSPWFHTHFSYKNWIYKSETLFAERWNELIEFGPPMVELLTWNDYGESHYFYKIKGALPAGSEEWVDGFDHSAWADLLPFFIQAYKANQTVSVSNASSFAVTSSSKPSSLASIPVTNATETVVFWYRSHPKDAVATADPLGQPTSFTYADDDLTVIAILESAATIVIHSGSKSESYAAIKGFNQITLEGFQEGQQQVEVVRNGAVVACGVGSVHITGNIQRYNFNAVVGKAVPGGCAAGN